MKQTLGLALLATVAPLVAWEVALQGIVAGRWLLVGVALVCLLLSLFTAVRLVIRWNSPEKPPLRDVNWTSKALLLLLCWGLAGIVVYVTFLGFSVETLKVLGTSLLVAGACLLVGFLGGFLFGIPRVSDEEVTHPTGGSGTGQTRRGSGFRTNLELISDWLTKIFVGVGLTQVAKVPGKLWALALVLAQGFNAVASTGTVAVVTVSPTYTLALVLHFLVVGFLFGYILTRLYLNPAIGEADRVVPIQGLPPTTTKAPGDPGLETTELYQTDPNKGMFGRQPKVPGRELFATVVASTGAGAGWYKVRIGVRRTAPGSPLTGVVLFHLHPTFTPQVQAVTPTGDEAVLELLAWGAFTVGAEVDAGATRLELDLATLEDAPTEFRER